MNGLQTPVASIASIQQIVQHQLQLLSADPALAHQLPPLMLWGPPGVGKSSVIRDLCTRNSIGFIDIRLAQREPIDLRGLPVPRDEHVDWLLAGEWPRDPESRGVILFDELTAADRALQVAAYELILDRRLGDLYQLPAGWLVIGAGNRATDGAVAQSLSSALANRFCHLELAPDLEQWCHWASSQQLHPDVIGFLRFQPEAFFDMRGDVQRGWPSPRSWERVARTLQHGHPLPDETLHLLIHGLVGTAAATEFLAFREWSSALPDVPAMLAGRAPIKIPTRADQTFAFCSALVHHLWRGPTGASRRRLDRFFQILQALSADFATLALMDAMQGPDEAIAAERSTALFAHPGFAEWSERHGEVFSASLGDHYRESA